MVHGTRLNEGSLFFWRESESEEIRCGGEICESAGSYTNNVHQSQILKSKIQTED